MSLTSGTRLGPYEIQSAIGAGGMGEVYKARDTRLDRTVAIKVLPPDVSGDPERRARFEREAKTIAGLNHPHICTLHDVGEHEGSTFLVMEHIVGETLAARLSKGALPPEQALTVATEIAEALSAAHRQGVIHRDLKPANVMLTKAGAKLLDFGLAKLAGHGEQPAASMMTAAPTQAGTLTGQGVIVGTLQYMAPEQLEGKPPDARTDLWALGAILYEMLTGKRAFEGESAVSVMSAIMEREPAPIASLQPLTPPALDRLVRRCLAKSPEDRPDTAHDVADELRWIQESKAGRTVAVGSRRTRVMLVLFAGLAIGGAVGAAATWLLRPNEPGSPPTRATIDIRPADALSGVNRWEVLMHGRPSRTAIALSPDGRLLVFGGSTQTRHVLYSRPLDRDEASPLEGTEGGDMPFFSPDGRFVGFWADGILRKVPAAGGPPLEICKTSQPSGASWGADGQVVFAAGTRLWRVPEGGGVARELTTPDPAAGERAHHLPFVLPDGKGVLYTAVCTRDASGLRGMVLEAATGKPKKLLESAADLRYVPTGHLLFVRQGKLRVVPFDLAALRVTGSEVAVADDVMQALNGGIGTVETTAAQVSVAGGVLAYVRGGVVPDRRYSIGTVDMRGTIHPFPSDPEPHSYIAPQLSPDGARVVMANGSTLASGLWVYDLRRGFLSQPVVGFQATFPVWTPDGRSIVFAGAEKGLLNLFRVPADGMSIPERLTQSIHEQRPACWGASGAELVFLELRPGSNNDILAMPVAEPGKARVLVGSRFNETFPAVSPDGQWLAYTSDVSGRDEVYVRPYAGGEAVRVSADGGLGPVWSPDGRRLFFAQFRNDLNRVALYVTSVGTGTPFVAVLPTVVWELPDAREHLMGAMPLHAMDVMPDGRSLLFVTVRKDQPVLGVPRQIELVLNWFDELKAKVPPAR